MRNITSYSCLDSPFGPVFIAKNIRGVCFVNLSKISEARFQSLSRKRFRKDAIRDDKKLKNAIRELSSYFNGHRVNFESILDLSIGTGFQRKVWEKVSEIPYGELKSYKWIADEIGNPNARAGRFPAAPLLIGDKGVCKRPLSTGSFPSKNDASAL